MDDLPIAIVHHGYHENDREPLTDSWWKLFDACGAGMQFVEIRDDRVVYRVFGGPIDPARRAGKHWRQSTIEQIKLLKQKWTPSLKYIRPEHNGISVVTISTSEHTLLKMFG